ncbi:uncharacterized protein LOC136040891 isoform X2 [Artemia franciscana]|uniref:BTB domain-containing protein n=1 Tax=Artemia franciscana TaxID=6661 RepID=A0AA88L023_ARTSF|nr:hypothetical protein QYM36_009682 [Artemia franciscana]
MSQKLFSVRAFLANLEMDDSPSIAIQCDRGTISVKKILLTITSDVFKTMFAANMLEKYTNVVSAKDINFDTMKTIIDYYNKGVVTDVLNVDDIAFSYIVEKYNFVGIKEAFAEILLDKYKKDENVEILEKIFTSYNSHNHKVRAVAEIATMIAQGKKSPTFVANLSAQDFLELSKSCCAILIGTDALKWAEYLNIFKLWAKRNSVAESVVVLEIIGMIDIRKFPASVVLEILEFSTLNKELERFKLILEKTLRYIVDVNAAAITNNMLIDVCPNSKMKCEECGHESISPFHTNTSCEGKHFCYKARYYSPCKYHKDSYRQRIPYGFTDDVFGSLTLID